MVFTRRTFECRCINDFYVNIRNESVKVATAGEFMEGYYSKNDGVPCFKVWCGEYSITLYDNEFNHYFRIFGGFKNG